MQPKKTKKICWVQHASEHQLFLSLARELSHKGYESLFVCKTKTAHQEYNKSEFTSLYASDEIFFGAPIPTDVYERLLSTYGTQLFELASMSDVHLLELYPNDQQARKTVFARALLYFEKVVAKESIDYFILRESAMFLTRSAFYVAKHHHIPVGKLMYGPGDNLCVLFDVGELDIWSELDEAVQAGVYDLTVVQKEDVDVFVAGRLPKSDKKMVMRFLPGSLFLSLKQYAGLWRHDTRRAFKNDPVYVATLRFARYRKEKQLIWKYVTQPFFKYAEVDENDHIIYFPTYSGLETSYLVHIPQWARNETDLMVQVARSLPPACTLYIKEHPHNPGDLNFFELRRLAKEPNVKIVKPWVSSQYLIEQSKLVVTIEGTAGWEAFLSKKPVLCIEDVAFYGRSNLVYKVTDLTTLTQTITKALALGSSQYTENVKDWYWFIHSICTTAGKGNTLNFVPPYGFITDPEEIKKVAAYIDEKVSRKILESAHTV